MNDSDESTAVLSIRKNFNEFISGLSESSLHSKLNFSATDDKSLQQQTELISTRGRLSQAQLQLNSVETARKRARIEHDKELENVRKEKERELDKLADMKRQLVRMTCREELTRQELADMKKSTDASIAELNEKLAAAQKEKLQLDNVLQDLKQDMRSKMAELKMENARLSQAIQKGQSDLHEAKQLLQMARRESSQSNKLQLELHESHNKLANCEQQIKELELALSRAEEDITVGKALKSQLAQLSTLEADNKKLTEENEYLRADQENVLLLKEECESLRKKLDRAEERSVKLSTLEVEHEDVKKRLAEWEAIECSGLSGLRTPAAVARTLAELQRNSELMLEKNGQLQARVRSLESQCETSRQQLQASQAECATVRTQHQTAAETIKRINRKLLLATKERDAFKGIIDSYESELTVTANNRPDLRVRQSLEEALENQRHQCTALEADLNKATSQAAQHKARVQMLEQQLTQLRSSTASSSSAAAAADTDCNQNIVVELRQRVAELEKTAAALTDEKENLLAQLERFDIQGEYDRNKTKVIQYSMNPYSVANRKLTSDLARLREENSKLVERVKILEEAKGNVDDLTTKVDLRLQASSGKEVEEMKAQLASAELKNKRLMEVFKKTSQELREVCCYQLLGYRINVPTTGQYQLMNIYAESPNDYFVFRSSETGAIQMVANDYSASFGEKIDTFLHGANSIPAFLSSVTLELFNRQTFIEGQSFR